MNENVLSESLSVCIGKRLISVSFCLHEIEGIEPALFDFAEVVLTFDAPQTFRYFSWKQIDGEFCLSVQSKSHLMEEPVADLSDSQLGIFSQSLGKRLTLLELYGDDKLNFPVAALFEFESAKLALAVGYDEWNEKKQKSEFSFFSGDTIFLWTQEEFLEAIKKQSLQILTRLELNSGKLK